MSQLVTALTREQSVVVKGPKVMETLCISTNTGNPRTVQGHWVVCLRTRLMLPAPDRSAPPLPLVMFPITPGTVVLLAKQWTLGFQDGCVPVFNDLLGGYISVTSWLIVNEAPEESVMVRPTRYVPGDEYVY